MFTLDLVDDFVTGLNEKHSEYDFSKEVLKKYIRIVAASPMNEGNRHVYMFLDFDGNLLKAAGWKSPAKGSRGVLTQDNMSEVLEKTDPFGGWLYRR